MSKQRVPRKEKKKAQKYGWYLLGFTPQKGLAVWVRNYQKFPVGKNMYEHYYVK